MLRFYFFFFNDTATTEIYTLSLHDALPILRKYPQLSHRISPSRRSPGFAIWPDFNVEVRPYRETWRSEEHTSELQSLRHLVCRLLLEKNKTLSHSHLYHPRYAFVSNPLLPH